MNKNQKPTELIATWENLQRIFIRPEDEQSRETLLKYMEQILFGLHDFLNTNVGVTEEISLKELTRDFKDTLINKNPEKKLADVIIDIIDKIAPKAVNVASPYFVGHMTSALPFFMVHLKTIITALNQNVNKLETSKILSVIEKQILAKLHRLVFDREEKFYQKHVQSTDTSLGAFTTGGTTANLTALWVARNKLFLPYQDFEGIENEGIAKTMQTFSLDRITVLVQERAHFSLRKAGGLLGIGNKNVIPIPVDSKHRIDLKKLEKTVKELSKDKKTKIAAVVGIAGTTETGVLDPLCEMAQICEENSIFFHVDAAWGGPVLLSKKYSHLLKGIEKADSVTMDCHKQFYMPMTSGMIYFKDPLAMDQIAYHSNYINRPGSVDIGIKTLEGSREANSLILDSALKIMGSRGYALMIDHSIETTKKFAEEIKKRKVFQLVSDPELNIVTYRVAPPALQLKLENASENQKEEIENILNDINIRVQRKQREQGKSFVSRTRFKIEKHDKTQNVVLRCVIMNPMTNISILKEILDEQEDIFSRLDIKKS
ncbi:MAG: putative pyridoxal-dependent aspartate 1-decarboxylase [Desulfobacteraceae bacterium]|nr:putative pyridoxal-dependent aspartate 1-decarboxylase [Desulfobacteraceae bacterium]